MDGQFQVAQAAGAGTSNNTATPRIYKLSKPLTDQAVVVNLGYDQKVKVDFSGISNEKITLVHVGEKLIILFDNQSTVTVEPFFKSRADGPANEARDNITVEMAPGRDISVTEFANLFPITTDTSVLPAADNAGNSNANAQATGANFSPFSVDPLPPIGTNVLAPQEELGNFATPPLTGTVELPPETPTPSAGPTITAGTAPNLIVDESFLTVATNGVAGSGQAPLGVTVATGLVPFTVDAPAGQQSLTFALSINNATTNLIDSATGQVVTLVQNGAGEVDGVVTINNAQVKVFTLTVDAAGQLTLTDLRAVHENNASDFNEGISLIGGLISLTATVTDVNGATASASVDVGSHLTFLDDGPVVSIVVRGEDHLVLDESAVGTDTAGGSLPVGLASVTANFADNFTGGAYGADGAGTTAYKLTLTGANVNSGLFALDAADKSAVDGDGIGQGTQIVLNQDPVTGVITGSVGATNYFTISIDSATGVVTFTQLNNIWHSDPNNSDDPATLTLANANLLQVAQTITDADGDHVSTPINLGTGVFTIQDDGPTASTLTGATDTLVLDETRPVGTDTAGGVAPSGLATVTANFADNFTGGSYGTDGAGSTVYKLTLTGSNVASGLFALDATDATAGDGDGIGQGTQIVLNQDPVTGVITGSVGATNYFTISIDATTGVVTFTQLNNIWHSNPNNSDDPATLTLANANLLQVAQTITDADGDHVSTPINLGTGVFTIQDDGPTLVSKTNLVYANVDNGTGDVGGTGIYQYKIGTDAHTVYDATHSDFAPITLTGTVGSNAISNQSVTWSSESSTTAVFNVAFDYRADPSSSTLTHDTGVLTFDKVNGTYNLVLDQPISSFSTLETSQGLSFVGYHLNSASTDNTQPDVMVTELNSSFWVQFTGETSSNNPPVALTAGNDQTFTQGEIFHGGPTWVSVSGSANGVAGDTIQKGELLDFNFFASNPQGFTNHTDIAAASTMFLKIDGFNGEDFVINLKLIDMGADGIAGTVDDGATKYLALVVDAGDVFTNGSPPPAGFGIVLDQNDGAIIIQSNDYLPLAGAGNWQIDGAQVITSTEGLTGSGVNFNGAVGTGATGASTTTEAFSAATVDNDVVKISDIGLITTTTTTQAADLQFNVSNVDADGDTTPSTTLDVQIAGNTMNGTANADVLQSSAGNDTMTGNGGNDLFVLKASNGGHDNIMDLVSGADQILVDIAGQNLTIGTSAPVAAANFHTGDENNAATWNGGTGNEFVWNGATKELWYSANGTGTDKVDLAHISTGIPVATDVHTF